MFHELPSTHGAEGRKYVWEKHVQLSGVGTVSVAMSRFCGVKIHKQRSHTDAFTESVHCVMDVMCESSSCFLLINPVRNQTNRRWAHLLGGV